MNLKNLRYRVQDDINMNTRIEIVGYDPQSEKMHRFEDEAEVTLKAYFMLIINKGDIKSFKILDEPTTYTYMLGGSLTDHAEYFQWGSELFKRIIEYVFTGEGGHNRKR